MPTTDVKKAQLIPLKKLPDLVDAAIRVAQPGTGGTPASKVIKRWEIIGRVARNFEEGQKFADAVTAHISQQGFEVKSAVLRLDRDIICGFIERGNLPIERQF
jgi:hypothetical protein